MKTRSQSLRASLLLPQDFSLFVKWQKEYAPGSDIGQVADAMEYYRFTMHREALLGGRLPSLNLFRRPQVALECGHAVHPSDTIDSDLCPICEVKAHLAFMHAITVAWDKSGGPGLTPGPHIMGRSYASLRASWHKARIRFQEVLDMFAVMVVYEEGWEAKHPSKAAAARSTNCASAAIRLAQAESTYPARLSPLTSNPVRPMFARRKTVTFAEEAQVKHGEGISTAATKLTNYRLRTQYFRPSAEYQRGTHACDPNSEYVDTSQMSVLMANVRNLKIYITRDEDAFDRLRNDPFFYNKFVGDHQGIVGTHELCADVFAFIADFPLEQPRQEELDEMLEEADRVVVLLDEGTSKILDMVMFDGSDEDENDDEDSDESDEGEVVRLKGRLAGSDDWTCLKESLA